VVHLHCGLPVRLHACSPPHLTATQLAQSSVLNRLIAPAGLSPAWAPASRAHQNQIYDAYETSTRGATCNAYSASDTADSLPGHSTNLPLPEPGTDDAPGRGGKSR
jgi:hypothetical protein